MANIKEIGCFKFHEINGWHVEKVHYSFASIREIWRAKNYAGAIALYFKMEESAVRFARRYPTNWFTHDYWDCFLAKYPEYTYECKVLGNRVERKFFEPCSIK